MLKLIKEYNLDKFNVSVYTTTEESTVVSSETLDSLTLNLNNETYPRVIVETLEVLTGVKRVVVSDKLNNVLVISTNGLLESNE